MNAFVLILKLKDSRRLMDFCKIKEILGGLWC